jgi:hypothetical protein
MDRGGPSAPPPSRGPDRGMSATTAWNMVVSLTLAAVTTAVRGRPLPSQTRWSLLPGLPRSTGLCPHGPPTPGPHAHGVDARPLPVQPAFLTEAVQDVQVQLGDPGVGPLGQPPPAGRGRAAAQFRGGQQPAGVEVRAMYTIAARHARSETVRCRPPYGGRGGAGSRGSTSAQSSSDARSSARVVMAPDPARPTPKERNDV